ncbi:MAG: L,D-transpeptidase family protein [Verrucomicrobiales bacterium]|nr:L,D-transpeptidase family protein [Verrucomicrobiales bacterium]
MSHVSRILLLRLSLLTLPWLAASCALPQAGSAAGQTQYLEAFNPNSLPPSGVYDADSVSYWDGAGMSGTPSVVIDLSDQKAYFYKSGQLAGVSALSTGDAKHPTPTGEYKITQKNKYHRSNLYGDYVDGAGNIVVANIDVTKDPRPPGTTFMGSKMTNFMRFAGGVGMHEGFLPGYPASHGCVRMPGEMARIFFENTAVGTPVRVQP